jgi:hypothetical protein
LTYELILDDVIQPKSILGGKPTISNINLLRGRSKCAQILLGMNLMLRRPNLNLSFELLLVVGIFLLLVSYFFGFIFASYIPIETVKHVVELRLIPLLNFILDNQFPEEPTLNQQRLFLTTVLFSGSFLFVAVLMIISGFSCQKGAEPFKQTAETAWIQSVFSAIAIIYFYFPKHSEVRSSFGRLTISSDVRFIFMACCFFFLLCMCFMLGYAISRVFRNHMGI